MGKIELQQWRKYLQNHIRHENKIFRQLKKLFKIQQQVVLDNLRKQAETITNEEYGRKQTTIDIDSIIFNEKEEIDRFLEDITPSLVDVVGDAGELALRNLGLVISFDILAPEVVDYIHHETFQTIRGITRTTARELRTTLLEGIQAGETPDDLTERIRKVFKGTIRGTAPRARLIARTEVTKFFNYGTLKGWEKSGIVATKIWFTAIDERVRPTHQKAHGQEVLTNDEFIVGGARMKHPGDPSAPVQEVANCRCTMLAGEIQGGVESE